MRVVTIQPSIAGTSQPCLVVRHEGKLVRGLPAARCIVSSTHLRERVHAGGVKHGARLAQKAAGVSEPCVVRLGQESARQGSG